MDADSRTDRERYNDERGTVSPKISLRSAAERGPSRPISPATTALRPEEYRTPASANRSAIRSSTLAKTSPSGKVIMRIGIIIIIRKFLRIGLVVLLVTACSGGTPTTADGISIVATTSIVADVVSEVAGGGVTVTTLIPAGVDPHDAQISQTQAVELREADLVVGIGLGLEEGLADVLEDAQGDGVVVVELGTLVEVRYFDDGTPDPHLWLDPYLMATIVDQLPALFAETVPDHDWNTGASRYAGQLRETGDVMGQLLADVEQRQLITGHAELGYFADRFDFEVAGVLIPGGSTTAAPSSAQLAALVGLMEREGIRSIFSDVSESDDLAQSIAGEFAGSVSVVDLHVGSVGGPGSSAETLIDLLLFDANAISAALGPGE